MKILWDTNLKTQKIAFEEFNNTLITQEIPAIQEFEIWRINSKKNKNNFTFCDYPFIMEIAFKAKILEEEMKYEQRKEQKSQYYLILNYYALYRYENLISKTWVDLLSQSVGQQQPNSQNMDEEVSLTNGQLRIPRDKAWKALFFTLEVRREFLVEDALKQLQQANVNFKKELRVKFIGEEGIDQGGVRKEFFQLIVKQLFSTSYGMFVIKNVIIIIFWLLWINGCSTEMNLYFELVGNILGLAIYNAINLDLHLPNIIYKKLLNEPYSIENLKEIEPEIYSSLKFIQDYKDDDLEQLLLQPFSIKIDSYGEDSFIDLKPNGSNIPVTNQNKQEFIDLYLDWYLNLSIKHQFESFARGFNKVVHGDGIKFINSSELHTMICGSPVLDFYELEQSTEYEEPYSKSHQTIIDFWEIIHSLSQEEQKQFLFFTTGSDRSPIEGLSQLNFVISRQSADSERLVYYFNKIKQNKISLPTSHTCFNHLLIPEYSSKEKLKEKLLLAISNSEGFGLM